MITLIRFWSLLILTPVSFVLILVIFDFDSNSWLVVPAAIVAFTISYFARTIKCPYCSNNIFVDKNGKGSILWKPICHYCRKRLP